MKSYLEMCHIHSSIRFGLLSWCQIVFSDRFFFISLSSNWRQVGSTTTHCNSSVCAHSEQSQPNKNHRELCHKIETKPQLSRNFEQWVWHCHRHYAEIQREHSRFCDRSVQSELDCDVVAPHRCWHFQSRKKLFFHVMRVMWGCEPDKRPQRQIKWK